MYAVFQRIHCNILNMLQSSSLIQSIKEDIYLPQMNNHFTRL